MAVSIKMTTKLDDAGFKKAVKNASFTSLSHAGAAIRLTAQRLIKPKGKKPGPPDAPPHTKAGRIKSAIKYDPNKEEQSVIIGADFNVIGPAAAPHEHGDDNYKGRKYPQRPFMGPALTKLAPRLNEFWADTIGS